MNGSTAFSRTTSIEMATKKFARNLLNQEPGFGNCHALAADTIIVASRNETGTPCRVFPCLSVPHGTDVESRDQWALDRMRVSGERGCRPFTEPAPRWSAYIHSLRELGVEIETAIEPHGGEFSGHCARYILGFLVAPVLIGGAQ